MTSLKKRRTFKKLVSSNTPVILIGIYDALTAKLCEKIGWKALWSSSFCFSTSSGFPDANILTPSENLDMIQRINYQTKLPLIADCDSGYGDLAIFERVAREYEGAGVTGICIEDNTFPKRCSFYEKEIARKLVPINEHCAKIRLATKMRKDKNFFVIARTEAFIAGLGLKEALKRAQAYAKSGADAICVHSKKTDASEVLSFAKQWKISMPLVAIPTTYFTTSEKTLYESGYKIIIYANQLIRNSIYSQTKLLKKMKNEKDRIKSFSKEIVSLKEVFNITGVNNLKELNSKYYE